MTPTHTKDSPPSYLVQPGGTLRGELQVPGDKSISHRALMLGAIAGGTTEIGGLLASADCLATAAALRELGVRIDAPAPGNGERWKVHGVGLHGLRVAGGALDLGNSGTSMRLLSGLLCAQPFASVLVGDASLMQRPMERVAGPLRQMGADIQTTAGRPPVRIGPCGGLTGIEYRSPIASAQVKSALLLAGLYAEGQTRVVEPGISRDHTERMLQAFGVEVRREGLSVGVRQAGALRAVSLEVPGDLSSAAFFLVAGCLASDQGLVLRRVGINPTRTGVLDILRRMGAQMELFPIQDTASREPVADIRVRRSRLRGVTIDGDDVALAIDEFPALMVAAACASGTTTVSGAAELRVKESDRISAVAEGLKALGIAVEERPDGLTVQGGQLTGGTVESHGDHRIAMAFSIAALAASGEVRVLDTANVSTSFPGFAAHARQLGMSIEESGGQ